MEKAQSEQLQTLTMVQNLVYTRLPQFERRLTQLQNTVKELLLDLAYPDSKQAQGAIKLEETPRCFEETLEQKRQEDLRRKNSAYPQIYTAASRQNSVKNELSSNLFTPAPELSVEEMVDQGKKHEKQFYSQASSGIGGRHIFDDKSSQTIVNLNQSDLSRNGRNAMNYHFNDLKNSLVNFSTQKQLAMKNQIFSHLSLADVDKEESQVRETVESIEDATGRLSHLVRLMDENSKLMEPSDLTIHSYKSSIQLSDRKPGASNAIEDIEDQNFAIQDKLNEALVLNDLYHFKKTKADHSSKQTDQIIEDLLRNEDDKLFKQLDDLRSGSFFRKLNRAKQSSY